MKERNAVIITNGAPLLWGLCFIFQGEAANKIGPFAYGGARMLLGAFSLLPFLLMGIKKNKNNPTYLKNLLLGSLFCGAATCFACSFQQYGIMTTSAGKAGFLSSLYVLIVPVLALLVKKKPTLKTWICIFTGFIGAFLISFNPGEISIAKGDIFVLISSFGFAVQIMFIDRFSKYLTGPDLCFGQFFTAGVLSVLCALISKEPFSFSMINNTRISILYSGIVSCGIAYTLQIIGQKNLNPTKATLILCLESVYALLFDMIINSAMLKPQEAIGCLVLFASVFVCQIPEKRRKITS